MEMLITKERKIKKSTHVDFTPMVDLGFLLITFFILTTSMIKPKVLPYYTPESKNKNVHTLIKNSCVITVILGANHETFTYKGAWQHANTYITKYSAADHTNELRNTLLQFKDEVKNKISQKILEKEDQVCVIIKPDFTSRFGDLVYLLDELIISDIHKQAVVDISQEEQLAINNL